MRDYSIQENDFLNILEEENIRYKKLLNSKEIVLGTKIIKNVELLKKNKVFEIFRNKYKSNKIKKLKINDQKEVENANYERKIEEKKIIVYSCITGDYDSIIEPNFVDYNCDYILYTDYIIKNKRLKVWENRTIPESLKKLNNNILINRYIKMHPQEFFKDYDYSIYIDGNIKLISDVNSFVTFANNKTGLAFHEHSRRNCLYDEAKFCQIVGKGDTKKIKNEIKRIEKNNMPKKFGLLECNLIVTDLKNNNAKNLLNDWWNEFYQSECYRDQIILPYVIWKNNFSIKDIGYLGNNIFENNKIRVEKH